MAYTALYRKFRPDNFLDVKGQEHIVTTLKNQIKAGRIGHAYLFTGTRGTGKTTVAKLMAKVVNCENPVDGNPCNECRMCKGIMAGSSMNVIEIDAASNNGVDNVREIVEEVRYSPTEGKYKVYIIDEVHMLSAGAFNALLKTIEEPPSYVIFILATTEVHKIPVTILSRCQRYDFKRITIDVIADRLTQLMAAENIEAEEKALRYVARAADGSMRDALSLLDQCISFYLGKKLTYDNVLEVLGAVDTQVFARLLGHIRSQDVASCIKLLEEIESTGRELGQFTIDFIWYLRNLLLLKTTEDISEMVIEISSENLAILQQDAALMEEQTLIRYIRIFSELSNQLRYAARKRVLIEVALIKLCKPEMEQSFDSILNRVKLLEEKLEKGVVVSQGRPEPAGETRAAAPQEKKPAILPEALPDDLKAAAQNWKGIITQIGRKAPSLVPILNNTTLSIDGNQGLLLVVTEQIDKDFIDRENHMNLIKETLAGMFHKQIQISTRYLDRSKERMDEVVDLSKLVKMPIQYE
ncbi:MAG TPA: DNA polymerase III subunit gamma/tau [Clostridiales bacterium]|nr:DNA polymerase III subunit gamma/tau [Clostridiales bacterium]